jgi:hypothetical protein
VRIKDPSLPKFFSYDVRHSDGKVGRDDDSWGISWFNALTQQAGKEGLKLTELAKKSGHVQLDCTEGGDKGAKAGTICITWKPDPGDYSNEIVVPAFLIPDAIASDEVLAEREKQPAPQTQPIPSKARGKKRKIEDSEPEDNTDSDDKSPSPRAPRHGTTRSGRGFA